MIVTSAQERGRQVLQSNKYVALATVDANGPWAATLAYTIGSDHGLYFFSHTSARHVKAVLGSNHKVAGVIYDSHCTPETAESLQFSGTVELTHDRRSILQLLSAEQAHEVEKILQNDETLLFRIVMKDAYVLDQELYAAKGIDGRQAVDVRYLFNGQAGP